MLSAFARFAVAGVVASLGLIPAPSGTGASSPVVAAAPASTRPKPWITLDPSTIPAVDAPYLVAGALYGDPSGNEDASGVITMNSSVTTHLRRTAKSVETLDQILQAVHSMGGHGKVKPDGARDKIIFRMPRNTTIVVDLAGSVTINGVDAFHLSDTSGHWTTTAHGRQVRAFLAGFMQGEGNQNGKVGDDPSSEHLSFVKQLMATSEAYRVPTVLTGTDYYTLTLRASSYDPRVQAYPFIVYGRCPGGKPSGV
jgi:hypothetical protein